MMYALSSKMRREVNHTGYIICFDVVFERHRVMCFVKVK